MSANYNGQIYMYGVVERLISQRREQADRKKRSAMEAMGCRVQRQSSWPDFLGFG